MGKVCLLTRILRANNRNNDVRLEVHSFGTKSQVGIVGTIIKIEHKVLDLAIQIQRTKTVSYRTARKIRKFMTDRYFWHFSPQTKMGRLNHACKRSN
jgi:hypothetical protein